MMINTKVKVLLVCIVTLIQLSSADAPSSDDYTYAELHIDIDASWLLSSSYLVFFLQAGFGMLEAGMVRAKNTKNVLLKNLINSAICGLVFWAIGFGLAFGSDGSNNPFIGWGNFFLINYNKYGYWSLQWTNVAAAITILTGPMAERTRFPAYSICAAFVSAIVYPPVAHWIWSNNGWLNAMGMIDSTGSSSVHILGGAAGLIGSIMLGPRLGRFDQQGKPRDMPAHNATVSSLGGFILWYAWYGYTTGSTLGVTQRRWVVSARSAMVTTLGATSSLMTVLIVRRFLTYKYDLVPCINGLLAGLVSITAPCAVIEPWAAVIIGVIAGIAYTLGSSILLHFKIDDPLDASAVHLGCGIWGMIATGLFGEQNNISTAYPSRELEDYGFFYHRQGWLLSYQLVGIVAIFSWSAGLCGLLFYALKRFHILRVDPDTELAGIDNSDHGGSAYWFLPGSI